MPHVVEFISAATANIVKAFAVIFGKQITVFTAGLLCMSPMSRAGAMFLFLEMQQSFMACLLPTVVPHRICLALANYYSSP
jgi:hypothetical protein